MSSEEIQKLIDTLGQKLGPAGEHAWDILVRQQIIYGTLLTACAVVTIIATFALVWVMRLHWKSQLKRWESRTSEGRHDYYISEPDAAIWTMFGVLALAVGAVVAAMVLAIGLPLLLNPEYGAIQTILGAIPR